jgi:hypothetical protein
MEALFLSCADLRCMATNRWWKLFCLALVAVCGDVSLIAQQSSSYSAQARQTAAKFLAQRGIPARSQDSPAAMLMQARAQRAASAAGGGGTSLTAPWTFLGPSAIQTSGFGLVSGRVTSIASDPSDPSGNTIYVGTTGGGVWKSTNAAGPVGSVSFQPLTDSLPAFSTGSLASLSIGALSVKPSGGVVLAGTGDSNDASDSYYGTGILRSTDGGNTWSLIQITDDVLNGGAQDYSFVGEGFSGFAWSTANTHLVVAAVSQSREGAAVHATVRNSFAGLYYSTDDGQTWQLATITNGPEQVLQSPSIPPGLSTGNSVTSITWNPVRQRFYAAIRYNGYYESTDGITFTRLANQPGTNLTLTQCPANPNSTGSPACPIYRGTITTQPVTGDMFAITVAGTSGNQSMWQDQGLWQDVCGSTGSGCSSQTVTFASRIADAAIDDENGNIPQGDYNLALTAAPSSQDTLLFVGTTDIFRCSLTGGCTWRNTTNNNGCAAAQVAPSEHAIEAFAGSSGLMYFGNDGGLWRTTDGVNQQQAPCSANDAAHFQNLNGAIGSLAEVSDFSVSPNDASVMMASMGVFGTAAWQSGSEDGPGNWSQVLAGEGDHNAIDPENPQNWYATSAAPVSINVCTQGTACDATSFGSPEIGEAQVDNDGLGLVGFSAPWILDPQNSANMIVGTCRVWRGPAANGSVWGQGNALSGMLDASQKPSCDQNTPIQSLAASGSPADAPGTPEKIYAGLAAAGLLSPTAIGGHIYEASIIGTANGAQSWSDLSHAPVTNDAVGIFNPSGLGISSIYIDPHDATGNTVYATIQGFIGNGITGALVYMTTNGGASWVNITNNLPDAPISSLVVDPNDRNTVYIALDVGVYATRSIGLCSDSRQFCWSPFGTGLPNAPVTQLRVFDSLGDAYLRASTFGRGIWQIPLLTAGMLPTTATLTPSILTFSGQKVTSSSAAQTVTVTNTGMQMLSITSISTGPDFSETDNCTQAFGPGGTCSIQVSFVPTTTGPRQGVLTVLGNVPSGQVTASLNGVGLVPDSIVLTPGSLSFGNVLIGTATTPQNIAISNTGKNAVNLQSMTAGGDFQISANTCGTSLAPNYECTVAITFTPSISGSRTGIFSLVSDDGTQTVQLSGTGQAKETASVSPLSLNFPTPQTVGTRSNPQQITLTNGGDVALTSISVAVNGDFTYVDGCGESLIGHGTCAISVIYVPTTIGAEQGGLTVRTELGSQTVALSGTGVAPPGISATPATLNFGYQGVATTSSTQRITLTNNGGFDLTGLKFSVADTSTGAAANEFAVSGSSCPATNVLSAGSSCYLDLSFTPAVTGGRTGTFTAQAANLAIPLTVALVGSGEDFQLQVSGPSSAVIVNGQTATYQVGILPVSGSSGTVGLSCSGIPPGAICSLNPASVTLGNDTPSFTTITINTASSSTAALRLWRGMGIAFAALFPCVLFAGRQRRAFLRIWLVCFVTLLLMLPAACSVGATGGASSSGSSGSNPTGPYTVVITGSVPGLQRSVQLSLTVQ